MKRFSPRFLLLLLPLALVLPFAGQFACPAYSAYSDLAISHYPNAVFLRDSILHDHQIPLWSPLILSGYPFAANPLSGLWYPPGWLALLLPLPLGFNLLIALHWIVAGAGMYCWLREEKLDALPALLGAVFFEMLPRVFAHYAAGHLTLSYALAWTPWLLWAARRADGGTRGAFPFTEAIFMALIGLADLRWLAFAGLLWAAYRLYLLFQQHPVFFLRLVRAAVQPLAAALLCAPVLLPLLEYTRLSTRAALSPSENLVLSLPAVRLFSLASPSLDGNVEWTVYAGGAALALAVWALGNRDIRRRTAFWLAVAAVSLLLSLGDALPGLPLLYRLPGFDLLRVPSRFVILAGFALAATAAQTADYLSGEGRSGEHSAFWSRLLSAGLAGFTALAAFGAWAVSGVPPLNFFWGFGAIVISAGLLFLRDRSRLPAQAWLWLLILLTCSDLTGVNAMSVHYRPAREVLEEGGELADYLNQQFGLFRIFSSSYSLPQQTAAGYGLETASGIDPLQLLTYAKFVENASGVPAAGYSVVLPPVSGDDLREGNAAFLPDARLLGLLNVRYLANEFPLTVPGFTFKGRIGSAYLYQNQFTLPRAWVQPESSPFGRDALAVEDIEITPNQINLVAAGPGRLVLSEINYPGWQAAVDGRPATVETRATLFRSVALAPGRHTVRFRFRPAPVYAGVACAAVTLALLAVLALVRGRRQPG